MQPEYGSDFHFFNGFGNADGTIEKIYPDCGLYFSGRSAFLKILEQGIMKHNWKTVYLPAYYCHEVANFISELPISIRYYDDGPYNNTKTDLCSIDKRGNVYLKVNYFGFTAAPDYIPSQAFLIEDHTHDLLSDWARTSNAHYCFASLRKSLPVPIGGAIWSPKGIDIPPNSTESEKGNTVAYMKLCAMLMKKVYLAGGEIKKQEYRSLFIESEQLIGNARINSILPSFVTSLIQRTSLIEIRNKKRDNYKYLLDCLEEKGRLKMANLSEGKCPFGMVFYFNKQNERDHFKKYLIDKNIYPAVLWPGQFESKAKKFSNRSLVMHIDLRYGFTDMMYLAEVIKSYNYENENCISI